MTKDFKFGVLRETKVPPDKRVALPPKRILEIQQQFPQASFVVQPSELRCYSNEEYVRAGILLQEDLSDCDVLIGVKEVRVDTLIPEKTYLFFAHVAKEQPYNQELLQAILKKHIRLLDYEYFTQENGVRLIAFGRWAGIVGAYNGLRGLGMATGDFSLKPAHECRNREEMDALISQIHLKNTRILVSGGGRVAKGAMETLSRLHIREVSPDAFLRADFDEPVICRIDPEHYVARNDGEPFDYQHFFDHPTGYHSIALPYLQKTDLYIAAHYWDPESPRMFEISDLPSLLTSHQATSVPSESRIPSPHLQVIADISCDIDGSVPTTTHATTIDDPFYRYGEDARLLMMTVDNLPGELPRDASEEFSAVLAKEIVPRLIQGDPDGVIRRATITEAGALTETFRYLKDFAEGR